LSALHQDCIGEPQFSCITRQGVALHPRDVSSAARVQAHPRRHFPGDRNLRIVVEALDEETPVIFYTYGLTNRCSQLLAVPMSRFDFTKKLSMLRTLASASGG
jgi:uncharacterized protein (DUF1684 family)